MPWRRTLDRIWLGAIAVAAVVILPIWLILRIQDFGWLNVLLFILLLFLIGMYRAWPTDKPPQGPSSPAPR